MSKLRDDYKYAYISTATTTQVFSGQGRLHKIILGTAADALGDISIIDNTTGSTVNLALLQATAPSGVYEFNVSIKTGLRIITAAADKVTVVYSTNA